MTVSRKVFVSTRLADAALAANVARQLRLNNHQTFSVWHDRPAGEVDADLDETQRREVCAMNIRGIREANALLLLAHPDCRGSLIETTFAYCNGKTVVAVGDRRSLTLMASLPGIQWVDSVDEAIRVLSSERRAA